MPIKFLEFRDDEPLRTLSLCGTVCRKDPSTTWPVSEVRVQSKYQGSRGDIFVHLVIDRGEEDHGHFHLDFDLDLDWDSDDPRFRTVSVDEIQEHLEKMRGNIVQVLICGDFRMPLDELPRRGIISMLSSISTEACGAVLDLTGGTMSIRNDDQFHKLRWNISDSDLEVRLFADSELEVDDEYAEKLADVMRRGIACFVLETQEKITNGDENESRPLSSSA